MIKDEIEKFEQMHNWMMIRYLNNSFFFNPREKLLTFHPVFSLDNFSFFCVYLLIYHIENLWIGLIRRNVCGINRS